jgi:hypothetical protein
MLKRKQDHRSLPAALRHGAHDMRRRDSAYCALPRHVDTSRLAERHLSKHNLC